MNNLNIHVPHGTKLAVVGDIHEHEEQFDKLMEIIRPSGKMFFASVGDIYDKGFGVSCAESITDKVRTYAEAGYGFVIRGNHELKNIKRARNTKKMTQQLDWLERQPLAQSFLFGNGSRVTIVHGGVKPAHTWDDLDSDVETSYIRNLDEHGEMIKLEWVELDGAKVLRPSKPGGTTWHKSYDGRFGYIASGHEPLKNGKPQFFSYSCNLDTACYCTGVLTCQVFSEKGLEDLYSVTGTARNWQEP